MRAIRHSAAAVALGGLLVLAAAPAALADPTSGGDAYKVAVGVENGNIDYNDTPQAPDQGTTVSVGGDSNLGVPQPELARVPATGSDGIFSIDLSGPEPGVTFDGAPAPAASASTAAPADGSVAPADGSAETAPAEATADAAPAEGEAPPVPTCADYPSWYDAQLALESAADAALASSLDPDGNGIACEEAMS